MVGQGLSPASVAPLRQAVLDEVAARVPVAPGEGCVRVAVDGVDGAGKTTFADDLATVLGALGREVVRVGVDGFHHPSSTRYRRGRQSPEGFWHDSYDLSALRREVLDPLGPGGDRWYRSAVHDVRVDRSVQVRRARAPAGSVLVLDGLFLHRDELVGCWDLSVFLSVPFETTFARMALRDGCEPDPQHPDNRRYVEGQRLYLAAADPVSSADVVIDHEEPDQPRIVRAGGPRAAPGATVRPP